MAFDQKIRTLLEHKNILVTGGTGSIGSEFVKNILSYNPHVVRILTNSENELFEFQNQLKGYRTQTRYLLGDVRNKPRLMKAMKNIHYVFHAAALKHVPLCEYNPMEAVFTNVIGTNNVIEAAIDSGVEKVVNISTDKAVNPVNVMGACKLVGEKLISATSIFSEDTILYSVRFGNVLASRGSILLIIKDKVINGDPIPITDENMTRFVMTIPDAVNLGLRTMLFAKGGETFVLKMKKVIIKDLIEAARDFYCTQFHKDKNCIKIVNIGKRPGEKLSEALLTPEEVEYSFESDDLIVVPPNPKIEGQGEPYTPHPDLKTHSMNINQYNSDTGPYMTKEEITAILKKIQKYEK